MNEKQKYIFFVLLGLAGLAIGYLLGAGHNWYLMQRVAELEERELTLYEQAETADYQRHMAEVELGIEQAASKQLQQELAALQDEVLAQKRELSFYQKIMAPELTAAGVVVDDFELKQLSDDRHYQFRFAVLQTERQRGFVKGTLQATVEGRTEDDQVITLDLYELAGLSADQQSFTMRYFKAQTGSFRLPVGFAPEQVRIRVRLEDGSPRELERVFLWSELTRDNT
ncbi:DUF6776 family protein [Pseudidiomarina homiensis]|uniref:DUF6776 family protein n=1 Tax=Pseudidiomarina homiensis TaxID=364198 RepID=UPI00215B5C09|nr:DUF6776 family protein [Pseudidiomarina homiensis]